MIEFAFSLDYEIYGNGEGSLRELVCEPAQRLRAIFRKFKVPMVIFAEVAELEKIETNGTDPAINIARQQLKDFYDDGFELGLHLHPQWYNGRYESGKWLLDYEEYNLCTLPQERIDNLIDRSIAYFRGLLGKPTFTPSSFRAGNWLFQPTELAANALAKRGIKIDSSVFKGGLQRQHNLDYRRTPKNSYFWRFSKSIDVPDSKGDLLELPIYTDMVPFWEMLTNRRTGPQAKQASPVRSFGQELSHFLDLLRLRYPMKLDFCHITAQKLTDMIDAAVEEDQREPAPFRPIVAIGHTKDLRNLEPVEVLLGHLAKKGIAVSTFEKIYEKCV